MPSYGTACIKYMRTFAQHPKQYKTLYRSIKEMIVKHLLYGKRSACLSVYVTSIYKSCIRYASRNCQGILMKLNALIFSTPL